MYFSYMCSLTGWTTFAASYSAPAMYKASVNLAAPISDTFLDMSNWNKGVVFVNGFNVGRYWSVGPTNTLYVPAPLLNEGDNQVNFTNSHLPSYM